jgi:hypothetical protein
MSFSRKPQKDSIKEVSETKVEDPITNSEESIEKIVETSEPNDNQFKLTIRVEVGKKLIESDLDEALSIPTVDKLNPTVVSNMMAEIPSLHARWNFLYNEAVYAYDILKTKIEVWIAKKSQEYRKLLSQSDTKVTEKSVDDMIKADPDYQNLNDDLSLKKKYMKHILAQANGFGEKGDRLSGIASMMKWEAEILAGSKRTSTQYSHIKNDEDENKPVTNWPKP